MRPPSSEDAAFIFERYAGDPDVTRYLSWPLHRSIDDTKAFLQFSKESWEEWQAGPYLIWSLGSGRLLGSTGYAMQTPETAVTGYVLARDSWGNGYATEALSAMVNEASRMELECLTAYCHPLNTASIRVLEKCGFTRDADNDQKVTYPNLGSGDLNDALCFVRLI
jgi:ribosomal-protein-alanine N-acetyltransferase